MCLPTDPPLARYTDDHYRRVMRSRYRDSDTNTSIESESLRDQRRSLAQAIEALRPPQRIYMPGVSHLLDDIDPDSITYAPEYTKLSLPSSLPAPSRDDWCTSGLPLIEYRLRYAQAVDALNEIRRLRRLYRGLTLQAQKHPSPTERTRTRSRGVFESLNIRISRVTARYRDARIALSRLHPNGTWTRYLQELKRVDTQGPFDEDTQSKGVNFVPSWIWILRAPPAPPDFPNDPSNPQAPGTPTADPPPSPVTSNHLDDVADEEIEEYVRVDWAKAQERAKRFEEEIALTVEDMRRTLAFFAWKAEEWERVAELRANAPNRPTDEVVQGLQAYAYRQSNMYRALIKSFASYWYGSLRLKGLGGSWLPKYADIVVLQEGWNKIPSIIPLPPGETSPKDDSGCASDQNDDEVGSFAERDREDEVEAELHDFIDILAYS